MSSPQLEPHIGLVVEDDPGVRDLAVALLDETELDVAEVESAEAALAKAACTLWPTIRIVLTSGAASTSLDSLPECVTFMPKPWRGLDVLVQAEKALHQPQPLIS